jgi:hypothetical protein
MLRRATRSVSSSNRSNRAERLGVPSGVESAFFAGERACQELIRFRLGGRYLAALLGSFDNTLNLPPVLARTRLVSVNTLRDFINIGIRMR